MPSKAKEAKAARRTTQNGRPGVGMKIKFYEKKDQDQDESTLFNGTRSLTQKTENLPKTATLPSRRQTPGTRPSLTDVTSELAIYATVSKDHKEKKRKSKEAEDTKPNEGTEKEHHEDGNDVSAHEDLTSLQSYQPKGYAKKSHKEGTSDYTSEDGKANGLHVEKQDRKAPKKHVATTPDKPSSNEISFLTAEEIGRIYQSPPVKSRIRRHSSSETTKQQKNTENAKEYQWKIIESKRNLEKLQRSLSNDRTVEKVDEISKPENSENATGKSKATDTDPRVDSTISNHVVLSKQDSSNSVISNASSSSTISKKLLTLKEDGKHEKSSPRRSRKTNAKRFSWKLLSGTRELSSGNERERKEPSHRSNSREKKDFTNKRHTISAIEYSQADVSPASIRSERSISPSHPIAQRASSSDSPLQSPQKSPPIIPSPEAGAEEETHKQELINKKTSLPFTQSLSDDHNMKTREQYDEHYLPTHGKTIKIVEKAQEKNRQQYTFESGLKSPPGKEKMTPNTSKEGHIEVSKLASSLTGTPASSSMSSMPQNDSQLIFKVDLDEPFQPGRERTADTFMYEDHKERRRRKTEKRLPRKYLNYEEREINNNERKHINKWIQTEGPPIRPPESRTLPTQTGINPCSFTSKRLQVRPWNLPNHLSSNFTQTPLKKTAEASTQTEMKYYQSTTSQTGRKTYNTMETQTPLPPRKRDFAVRVRPATNTVDTQTADEDSEVWGSEGTISLDRLIRNGAIKRTQSMGLVLGSTPEKLRDRSASIDLASDRNQVNTIEKPKRISKDGTQTSGKITTYNWNENGKFVKIFVSYSGIHLLPSRNIQVKTNGINLLLTVDETVGNGDMNATETDRLGEKNLTSTLYLNRLRRPVSCLSYNVQRDMITIMLRKQKQTPWNALLFGGTVI